MPEKPGGFWERLGSRRFAPGKGVAEPPPQSGWRRFFFVLGTHFWKLILLNLLFLAFSIPLITIPAAFCGMNRVLIKLYRDGNCFVWTEFYKEFRANIWKALPFGLVGGAGLFASYYFLSLSISISLNHVNVFMAAIGVLLLFFTVLFINYVFVFLSVLDLKNIQIARNALIFSITEWKTNLAILGSVTASALLVAAFFPYTLFLVFFIVIALQQYIICAAINTPLQERIIGPFEGQNANHE